MTINGFGMKQKLILSLMLYVAFSFNAYAQVGTTFKMKDSNGHKVRYEIISQNAVKFKGGEYGKAAILTIPENVTYKGQQYIVKEIGVLAFSSCKHLKEIIIPSSVTEIGGGCFYECEALEKIKLPYGISELKSYCNTDNSSIYKFTIIQGFFEHCKNLKTIEIPASVVKLGDECFKFCEKLQTISLPASLSELGGACFLGCTNLKTIKLPDNIEVLPSLHDVNKLGSFTYGCFESCSSLEEIVLPAKLKKIEEECFRECTKLKKVKGLNSSIHLSTVYYRGSKGPFWCSAFNVDSAMNTFSFYAEGIIRKDIEDWQQKKEFETVAQYQARVTKAKRDAKLQELIAKYRKEYIANAGKNQKLNFSIGNYDSEYNVFPLTDTSFGTKYVRVPLADAPAFKENFEKALFVPTYDVINNNLALTRLDVSVNGKTYQSEQAVIENNNDLVIDFGDLNMDFGGQQGQRNTVVQQPTISIDHSIDQNIPTNAINNKQTFAVIIGNERYTQVAQVPYANNDARIFAEYCKKTLGLPEKNVKVYENATYGTMIGAVSDIQKIARAFKGDINVIFYYAGHGIPDEATGDGYLLPIDADGMNMRVCYPLSQLYKDLASMQARSVTCFMDACFSGAQRGSGMVVAARGVTIKAKNDHPTGNTVVFTAATDKQTAYPYEEKGHGMFTYYLLKKLRDTKGDCTLGELGTYICDEVAKQAVVTNGKEQTPVVLTSTGGVADSWKTMKLK